MTAHPRTIISAALLGLLLTGCARPAQTAYAPESSAIEVSVATTRRVTLPLTQQVVGTLRPADHAVVSARLMGTVSAANFTLGETVVAGAPLVTLSAEEIAARLTQAQAALDATLRDFKRESVLVAQGASTAETVRALADKQRAAEAAVKEAQTLLDYRQINAPFTGVITQKFIQPGDLASPGTPLFAIEAVERLQAEVQVPASLSALPIGTTLTVTFPSGTVTGSLVELSPAADPMTRTRLAKVALPKSATSARSGDFSRVDWPAGETDAITVPASAVSDFGQMERVFVVADGHAHLRLVKTAGPTAQGLRIAAGLDADEIVITAAPSLLRDGQAVKIQP